MIRTQIQLTDEQARRVKRIAAERQVSMATVIRQRSGTITDIPINGACYCALTDGH